MPGSTHTSLCARPWLGRTSSTSRRPIPTWEKWRPRNPTSPHWYDESHLHALPRRARGERPRPRRARTVRAILAEFRGLASTAVQRKILNEVGCSHHRWPLLRRAAGQHRRHRQAARGDEERIQQAGPAQTSGRHRARASQTAVPGGRRQRRDFRLSAPHGGARRHPFVVEFAFGLHERASADGVERRR